MVTELGVDANYNSRPHLQPGYGVREVRTYQELLLHARPAGTMNWEFTSDYSLVGWERQSDGRLEMLPTDRFFFAKQFCNLTPPRADALATSSDHPKVFVTAFVRRGGSPTRLHDPHRHPWPTQHKSNILLPFQAATSTILHVIIRS